ncbi:MAG: histidine kinase [Rikenellaceae bacterium]|nr:histidine kinase [Rikenellaceae bacterium]
MILKVLLIVTIILQLVTAAMAIRLIRYTKYNSAWIILTAGLTLMVLQRLLEFAPLVNWNFVFSRELNAWLGVFTSLCFTIGIIIVRKIIGYIGLTERKRRVYERRILNAVIRTEEKERQRFSKELHDGLGPLLSSAKMSVSALERMCPEVRQQEVIANTYLVIDEAVRSLRELSNNMNPNMLMSFGLGRAVNNFIKKLSAFSQIRIHYSSNLEDKRFDSDVELILYRVICEIVNNSIKHASARHINLSLMLSGTDEINIIFEDDGMGFVPEEVIDNPDGGGMGMSNIISRITSLKGVVDIDSAPDRGTRIYITAKTTTDD